MGSGVFIIWPIRADSCLCRAKIRIKNEMARNGLRYAGGEIFNEIGNEMCRFCLYADYFVSFYKYLLILSSVLHIFATALCLFYRSKVPCVLLMSHVCLC